MKNVQEKMKSPFTSNVCTMKTVNRATTGSLMGNENKSKYIRQAKNGVELIYVDLHVLDLRTENNKHSFDNFCSQLAGAGTMIDDIHEYGAKVILPIAIKSSSCSESVVRAYVQAALIAKLVGYNGIQLDAIPPGYLNKGFDELQQVQNARLAASELRNRLAFVNEIITKINNVCGNDFAISLQFQRKRYSNKLDNFETIAKVLGELGFCALYVHSGSGKVQSWATENCYLNSNNFFDENIETPEYKMKSKGRPKTDFFRRAMLLGFV